MHSFTFQTNMEIPSMPFVTRATIKYPQWDINTVDPTFQYMGKDGCMYAVGFTRSGERKWVPA